MKIIIAAEIFSPDIGGPATYSKILAEELIKGEHKVEMICYSAKVENDGYGFEIKRILRGQSTIKRYLQYFLQLLKISCQADVIYAQGPVCSGLPAFLVSKILRKKLVVKVVGDYAWEQAQNLGKTGLLINDFQKIKPKGKIGWLKKIEKIVCQRADRIIVPSQYLKKIVSGWGVAENKIEVIYNAINPGLTTQYKSPKGIIISIGRLVPWKGFEILINLMPELLKEIPNLKLEIYGGGPDREKLKKLIIDLGLEKKVIIEKVDHNQLMLKLTNAELFVLNTGYEGFPHTILEAMAVGVPVAVSHVGGNPELVVNNENGLLFEHNNKEQIREAILKLYNNPELRQKFVRNSKKVLEKFSFENMINETIRALAPNF